VKMAVSLAAVHVTNSFHEKAGMSQRQQPTYPGRMRLCSRITLPVSSKMQ
jgi:hypothetical protein